VAVIGDEERARGEVAVKDLQSGVQQNVKQAEVASKLRGNKALS
jgi:histidyl-tRNA synthetase